MTLHEQFAEDLAVYAIGALEGQERSDLELHLRDCSDCQAELAQLRGDAALLALSVSGPVPSQQAKQRFLRSISSDLNHKSRQIITAITPLVGSFRMGSSSCCAGIYAFLVA
jgi:hypothetical protein